MSAQAATIVCPRPATDRRYPPNQGVAAEFPAGGGLNAVLAAECFFGTHEPTSRVLALGFVGAGQAAMFKEVQSAHTEVDLVEVPGEVRVNIYRVVDGYEHCTSGGSEFTVTHEHVEQLKSKLRRVGRGAWVVLTGSLPPGVLPSFYADLIAMLHSQGAKVLLDAGPTEVGIALKFAPPDILKLNADELSELVYGAPIKTDYQLRAHANRLMPKGVVVFSLGKDGIFVRDTTGRCWRLQCDPADLEIVSRIGCGDSFDGVLTAALSLGYDLIQALKRGVAASVANTTTTRPGVFDTEYSHHLVSEVKVRRAACRFRHMLRSRRPRNNHRV
jgi:fructose-1-phosphate kinase PfkB-like protein